MATLTIVQDSPDSFALIGADGQAIDDLTRADLEGLRDAVCELLDATAPQVKEGLLPDGRPHRYLAGTSAAVIEGPDGSAEAFHVNARRPLLLGSDWRQALVELGRLARKAA